MKPQVTYQTGFAAISAIFLIVVLAALGGYMVTFSNTQHLTAAQDFQGTRAYWAARGGLEWAVAGVLTAAPAASAPATCPSTAPPATLDSFALVITCTSQTFSESGLAITIFQLTSVASTPGAAVGESGFVERSVSASIER